ncbi:hypothetical protein FEP36_02129 [Burkholderia multivorans]|nr:hypothetical protein [Burkholderia multivorans]
MRDVFGDHGNHVALFEQLRDEQQRGRLHDVRGRRKARALKHEFEAMAQHAAGRRDDPRGALHVGERERYIGEQRMAGAHDGRDRLAGQRLVAQMQLVVFGR